MSASKVAVSSLRDPGLAPEGHLKIEWVREHMPVLNEIRREFERDQPFAGRRVAICLHLEAKTAYLCEVMAAGGADVHVCGSNPLSTQDDVCAALAEDGVTVHAWHNASPDEYMAHIHKVIDARPELLHDDGGDLVTALHSTRTAEAAAIICGSEETTTGVIRLRAMERDGVLRFPMLSVNDAQMKHFFDNRYGTGQAAWDGVIRTTNLTVAGSTVVVGGYGYCGKGVAVRAKGLGARRVIVTEVNPVRANEALMDGFDVAPMVDAVRIADFLITTTGCEDVVREEHLQVIKGGCILANAGHFDSEISKPALAKLATGPRRVRKNIDEYAFADGRKVYLLGEGRLVNLACADGHPAEIMDTSFAVLALTLRYGLEHAGKLPKQVINVSEEIDHRVAEARLRSLGVAIDRLTPEQERYLHSWQL